MMVSNSTPDASVHIRTQDGMTPNSDRHIHFFGGWDSEDLERVSEVVEHIETRWGRHLNDAPFGKPWVCVRHDTEDEAFFFAHRIGEDLVARGKSVDTLCDSIEDLFPKT